tara:strand:- start:144 stop:791 length:648 start_codon:yes stop_codon:yes gene_type:complete
MENNFIKVYRNVLPKNLCNQIIDTYERLWTEQEERIKKMSICYNTQGFKTCRACDCQRLDIMQHEEFRELNQQIVARFQASITQYKHDCNLYHNQWPKTFRYENFRLKRFLCDTDQQHDTHVDVSNADNAKRFLALVCYLNDDFDEGETEFPQFNIKTKVESGSLALFPVAWTYLHRGRPPKNGYAKYMLGSFLQYDQKQNMDILGYKTMGVEKI